MGNSNIVMYTTEDGLTKIEVTFEDDTVWLSLEQMAEFQSTFVLRMPLRSLFDSKTKVSVSP